MYNIMLWHVQVITVAVGTQCVVYCWTTCHWV